MCVLLVNGAQHSPQLCRLVGPKGKFQRSTQMCVSKILQSQISMILKITLKMNISSKFVSIWSSGFMHLLTQTLNFCLLRWLDIAFFRNLRNMSSLITMLARHRFSPQSFKRRQTWFLRWLDISIFLKNLAQHVKPNFYTGSTLASFGIFHEKNNPHFCACSSSTLPLNLPKCQS